VSIERLRSSQPQYRATASDPAIEKRQEFGRVSKRPPGIADATVRRAHRRDVERSPLKRTACQLYGALCDCLDQSTYTGLAWPKVETLARRLKVSPRTVQRGLDDLLSNGWIGTPVGDSGGAGNAAIYHLHSEGRSCLFCTAAARTISQRGAWSRKGDRVTPFSKNKKGDSLSPPKDDKLSPLPAPKGDSLAKKDDIFDRAYKERHSLMTFSKSTSPASEQPPEQFGTEMDREIELDEGALRRLWRETRAILPDATSEEIRHFFAQRARVVFRNRRLDNPIGVLLNSIPDWFSKRRVVERRSQMRQTAEEGEALKRQIADVLAISQKPAATLAPTESCAKEPLPPRREPMQEMVRQIQIAAASKGMR
jgi:Helix-turn-helix domain